MIEALKSLKEVQENQVKEINKTIYNTKMKSEARKKKVVMSCGIPQEVYCYRI